MPRGVKSDSRTFTAYRQKSGYRIAFTWTEGQTRMQVRFVGDETPFDAPSVYDFEKGEVTITGGEGFMREVNAYWADFSHHDLIAHWQNRRVE